MELRVDNARYHHPAVLPFLRIKATQPVSTQLQGEVALVDGLREVTEVVTPGASCTVRRGSPSNMELTLALYVFLGVSSKVYQRDWTEC